MSRPKPLGRDEVKAFEQAFQATEQILGFVPNSMLIMARKPEMLAAVSALGRGIMDPNGAVPGDLKALIGHVASRPSNSRYCLAHTGHIAATRAVAPEKIEAVPELDASHLFTNEERAALRFARSAAAVPNAVTDKDFEEMHRYFSEEQIVEILGVVALFGFFNRWNDTLATELESEPLRFARQHLEESGWSPGKHGR